MSHTRRPVRVLFVCLGNICRSPTAHGMLRARLAEAGLAESVEVESAGTGTWHIGHSPDARAMAAAAARDIDISDLRARKVARSDFTDFDYVIAMDYDNLSDLQALAAGQDTSHARVQLMGDFSPTHRGQPVGDPYYGGEHGFERVLDMLAACVDGLMRQLQDDIHARSGESARP